MQPTSQSRAAHSRHCQRSDSHTCKLQWRALGTIPALQLLSSTIPRFKHQASRKPVSGLPSMLSTPPQENPNPRPHAQPRQHQCRYRSAIRDAEDPGLSHSRECISPSGAYATARTLPQLACLVPAARMTYGLSPRQAALPITSSPLLHISSSSSSSPPPTAARRPGHFGPSSHLFLSCTLS